MEEEVLHKYKSRREQERALFKVEVTPWNGEEYAKTRDIKLESGEKIAGRAISLCSKNTISSVCKASMGMDVKNRWWVSEILAKDCEKAWTHTGCEDTIPKWYAWLEHMKKKDEKEKWRRCISEKWKR